MHGILDLPEVAPPIETYPGAQAVSRAIALLKAFSDQQPEWTLSELAQRVGLNKATVHRLLAALEAEQFITRNPATGGYRLGPELIVLGGCAVRANDLPTAARPALEELADATGETTSLEVLAGGEVMILDEVSSRHLLGIAQDVGMRLPLHATSTGKLLLAHLGQADADALLAEPLPALTAGTITSPATLRRQLAAIRAEGYAVTAGELEIGFSAVAAPVRNAAGRVVAAVSVGGPSSRLDDDTLRQVIQLTRRAGEQVSRRLGFRGNHSDHSQR